MRRLKILVWHVHGTYLNCLVQAPHDFYLPVKPGRPTGYGGRGPTFCWPDNAIEVPAEEVRHLPLDLVIYQTPQNYLQDSQEILADRQRRLPSIYLEHNTPKEHPTDTRHPIRDSNVLIVHVTHFNRLMWDNGDCPTTVIEHGYLPRPELHYTGDLDRGIVVVNDLIRRARITGLDIFLAARERVPLDLFGFQSLELGGRGDLPQADLLRLATRYRFFFNPIRYTSFPLAVIEAMGLGLPIVALATTELPTVIEDGVMGFISNDLDYLVEGMHFLLRDRDAATRLGRAARQLAESRFPITRFVRDWDAVFRGVAG